MTVFDGKAVITGAGQSDVGRRLDKSGLKLTVEACLAAIADAGLSPDDIDGLAAYPGPNAGLTPGFTGAETHELRDALGLRTRWFLGTRDTAGQLGPVMDACMAIATGLANHVVCFRSVKESSAQMGKSRSAVVVGGDEAQPADRAQGFYQWVGPYGAVSAVNWIGMFAQRYMHEHGLTREQLGQIALNDRRNAARNPRAIYRDPMSLEDYLGARMISYPFCLYDCDVPCDGATAVVVSRREAATGLRRPPLTVESVGTALYERHTWDQRRDLTTMGAHDAGSMLWEHTSLRPTDVRMAQLYDGFSYLTLQWLEALGLCEHGQAGRFIDGGQRIAPDGELPLNTHGGQLSAGRLHGYGFLHEACVQMWEDAGERQVPRTPDVVAVGVGGGPVAGCMLLTRAS